jgi:hypothetical protein
VYIEFSSPNILIREDEKIWKNRFINNQLPTYFNFLEFNDHKLLAIKNTAGYTHSLFKSLKQNIKIITLNKYNYIDSLGGYLYLKRNKTERILDTISLKSRHQKLLKPIEISDYNLLYLDKIIILCHSNNVKPILIRSPYHEQFIGKAYEASFQIVKQNRYDTIGFLDFEDFSLEDDEFGDLQHLNLRGAHKYSNWFNQWLNKHSKD